MILAGYSNIYTHYTTTFQEYQAQRYEAASTIYGPNTLAAYQEQYARLTRALVNVIYILNWHCLGIQDILAILGRLLASRASSLKSVFENDDHGSRSSF